MVSDCKVFWLFNSMGYNNDLLYWQPLLQAYVKAFPNTEFHTCETQAKVVGTEHEVSKSITTLSIKLGSRALSIPSPLLLYKLFRVKPELIVTSEFGLLSIYAALYRLFYRRTKLLLLVENDPAFLAAFYNKNRKTWLFRAVRKCIAWRADSVLCNNRRAAEYLTNDLGIDKDKVIAACYLTSFQATNSKKRDRGKTKNFLFVGRLIPSKGLSLLVEAVSLLPDDAKDKFTLSIVGDGPERARLEQAVKDLNLEKTVIFHGRQPYEQLGNFFTAADLFIFPTLGDYRALVGFEALSAGLPIIGSIFDGASDETIEDGVNGFVVDPRQISELSRRIRFFLDNSDRLKEFSARALVKYSSYEPAVVANNLVDASSVCLRSARF